MAAGFSALALGVFGFALAASAGSDAPYAATTLYAFQGDSDGYFPNDQPIADSTGSLYGVTYAGGDGGFNYGHGALYKLTRNGSTYQESVLYRFDVYKTGTHPAGRLAIDSNGVLYGITPKAGAYGRGTVYSLTPGSGGYTHAVLYSFPGGKHGKGPTAGVTLDNAGDIFGTTGSAGDGSCKCGTVFELVRSASGYSESVIYTFHGTDGASPSAELALDARGDLYGTTAGGGANGQGTVFELTPNVAGYSEKVLYSFAGNSDGAQPTAPVVIGARGAIYGTTRYGGVDNNGTVFKLRPIATGYAERVIYAFHGPDGTGPYYGVTLQGGILFGTTLMGGSAGQGVAYSLTPDGASYSEQTLYTFPGTQTFGRPVSNLLALNGALIGTAGYSPSDGGGAVYQLTPQSQRPRRVK